MNTSYFKEQPKKQEYFCNEEESEGRRAKNHEVETQDQTVLTLGLDKITKFVYGLDGPLVRETYCGLTSSVFRLDIVKFQFL
jgi:hypothetical protein